MIQFKVLWDKLWMIVLWCQMSICKLKARKIWYLRIPFQKFGLFNQKQNVHYQYLRIHVILLFISLRKRVWFSFMQLKYTGIFLRQNNTGLNWLPYSLNKWETLKLFSSHLILLWLCRVKYCLLWWTFYNF